MNSKLAAVLLAVTSLDSVRTIPVRLTVGPPQPPFGRRNLLDPDGRQRLLRGVNIGVQWWAKNGRPTDPALYADGACPPVNATTDKLNWRQPPVCGVDAGKGKWNQSTAPLSLNDLAEIRALGFNTVRLAIGWASLEPEPGKVSAQYIERIAQVVEWAAEQDIWVFIDLHQDGYSFWLPDLNGGGWNDGAPEFACPPLSAYNDSSIISKAEVELVEKAIGRPVPKSFFATEGFYQNRPPTGFPNTGSGLQEHYIKAVAQVIKRFVGNPTVIGYEIQNEPMPGSQIDIYAFSKNTLYPFYKRFIQAVTGVRDGLPECDAEDPFPVCNKPLKDCPKPCAVPDLGVHDDKIYLFEPCVTRNSMDYSMQHFTEPWTEYGNLIFAPHQYTGVFTAGRGYNKSDSSCCQPPFNKSLDTAWQEAKPMNASVLVTEWGAGDSAVDMTNLEGMTTQQDLQYTSTTYWDWKQNGCGSWPLYKCATGSTVANSAVDTLKLSIVSRVIPAAVVGFIDSFSYNYTTQVFAMRASAPNAADMIAEGVNTLVYVPAHVNRKPSELVVGGVAKLSHVVTQPDGSWIVEVAVEAVAEGDVGEYTVQLGDDAAGNALAALPRAADRLAAMMAQEDVATEAQVGAALRAVGATQRIN